MNAVTRVERRRQVSRRSIDRGSRLVSCGAPHTEALFLYLLGAIPFWLALLYFPRT